MKHAIKTLLFVALLSSSARADLVLFTIENAVVDGTILFETDWSLPSGPVVWSRLEPNWTLDTFNFSINDVDVATSLVKGSMEFDLQASAPDNWSLHMASDRYVCDAWRGEWFDAYGLGLEPFVNCSPSIDSGTFTAVPEPSSMALMFCAFALVTASSWMRGKLIRAR